MYFIKSGKVKLIKKIKFKKARVNLDNIDQIIEDPTPEDEALGLVDERYL